MGEDTESGLKVCALDAVPGLWAVYDRWGGLLGLGSRRACDSLAALLGRSREECEFTPEFLAAAFERWRRAGFANSGALVLCSRAEGRQPLRTRGAA